MAYNTPMASVSAAQFILGISTGIVATLIGVLAKYFVDDRTDRRRLQLQERAAVSDVMGNSLGQLRQSIIRLHNRLDSVFRDDPLSKGWLEASPRPEGDSYFLRSINYRLFAFLSWAAIVQWSIDMLPPETLKEHTDLQKLYKQLDDAKYCLTNYLILHESEHDTHEMGTVFLMDVLDDLGDLGLQTYQRNEKTIPPWEIEEKYRQNQYPLRELRSWLALQGVANWKTAIILARLACLRECLDLIQIGPNRPQIDRERLRPQIDEERLDVALAYAETSDESLNLPADVSGKLKAYLWSAKHRGLCKTR
jgi:hypothetical protein